MGFKLLLIRHAHAGDREEFAATGQPDELRPLSKTGIEQAELIAAELSSIVARCDAILSSPYVRARQTADFLSVVWEAPVRETSLLEPDSPARAFAESLGGRRSGQVVCAVGHEPHLGELAAWLLSESSCPLIEFPKGGACMLEFSGSPRAGAATIRWMFGPKQLAKLGSKLARRE